MTQLIRLFFLLNIICSFSQDSTATTSPIPWSKNLKLTWADFKASPNTKILAYAQTSYKIEIEPKEVNVDSNGNIQNYEKLSVIAYFYPNHSWGYKKDAYLLKHEQLHFDIAGLYALKINNKFQKLINDKKANFDAYFEIYEKLWNECRETQRAYDKETQHGQLIEVNEKWIKRIKNEIISIND
jgi:hypothetical protein